MPPTTTILKADGAAAGKLELADSLFGAPVNLDFRFHVPRTVIEALHAAQFTVIEHVEREPYEGAEHPSRRCYLLARAV